MAVSGCAHVEITDSEWCGDMGASGAECFHTLTTATEDLTKVEWDAKRFGWVCTEADTFADWKSIIEKLCNKTGLCDYETQASLNAFFDRVKAVHQEAKRPLP
jgi:hypothetical protein